MKFWILLFSLFISLDISAQKQDYIWFLGKDQSLEPGIQGMMIDWNENAIPVKHDLAFGIDNNNASICDKDGNLLFWSNGCAVINREQEVMPHGDTLNWDAFREVIGWEECIRGYPAAQNIKILPDPSYKDGFYIVHKAWKYNGQFEDITMELRHSYVDMTLDGGRGDVVYFDSILYEGRSVNHCLEAIYSDNGKDWWILQPVENDSLFLTYQINENGIERFADQASDVHFKFLRAGGGTMRFSPDGTKLAYYDYFLNLHVYDFNRTDGVLSNHQEVIIFDDVDEKDDTEFRFGSVEWSPNSRFMYVPVTDSLFQIDSWEIDINDGIRLIDVYDGTQDPFATTFYISSLAPDCKIYICSGSGTKSYHVINKPNQLGIDCNFIQNGLVLPQNAGSANLPLFPRFRVDEEEVCDSTITSIFGELVYYRRDLDIFPNPTTGPLTINLPQDQTSGHLQIIDNTGKQILRTELEKTSDTYQLDLSAYPSGIYHVEYLPQDNKERLVYTGKVVLTHP